MIADHPYGKPPEKLKQEMVGCSLEFLVLGDSGSWLESYRSWLPVVENEI